MTVLILALYVPLLGAAALAVWRRPVLALYAFVAGLAVHNCAMVLLYGAGVRGAPLTVVAAWKEALLAVALAAVALPALRRRRLPFAPGPVDVLAALFAAVVVVYALIPQDVLGGEAGAGAIAHAVRYLLVPVAAYVLGRSLALGGAELRRLAIAVVAVAVAVAGFGIVELYAVSLDWWRASGAPGWYGEQLGLESRGLSGLPENFVFNTGDERPLRRLVSTFTSPLASAYLLVVALLLLAAAGLRAAVALAAAAVLFPALLLTQTRAAFLVLAGGLVVLAALRRRAWPAVAAVGVVVAAVAFLSVHEHVAPRTTFTPPELEVQREGARRGGEVDHDPLDLDEPSLRSHWLHLRDGAETIVRHPQGHGPGNAGTTARRFGERPLAGESNLVEVGVELGVIGLLLFLAWNFALLAALARRAAAHPVAGIAVAFAATLALAVQTDVVAVPWLAFSLWGLAGAAIGVDGWRREDAAAIVQGMSRVGGS